MTKSKIILGVNTYHADSSACLIINGKLVAAIEEERLNRIKHYAGFPSKAIKECLIIGDVVEKGTVPFFFSQTVWCWSLILCLSTIIHSNR